MTRTIDLTSGHAALVDDEDWKRLAQWRWGAMKTNGHVYARRNAEVDGKRVPLLMHRVIVDAAPGLVVDHINGNGLDNRRENLRQLLHAENLWNKPLPEGRYRGVSWSKAAQKWRATIDHRGKKHDIGFFASAEDAARAFDYAAKRLRGHLARCNFAESLPVDELTLSPTFRRFLFSHQ